MANLLIKLTGEWFTHHVPCYPDNLCFNIHLQKKKWQSITRHGVEGIQSQQE